MVDDYDFILKVGESPLKDVSTNVSCFVVHNIWL